MWLGLCSVALWSTAATAFKIALRYLDPYQLLLLATAVSALVLLAWVMWSGQLGLLRRCFFAAPRFYLLAAVLNPCIYYLILFQAYDLLPAQQAQAINYTWAITMSLMAVPLLKQSLSLRSGLATVAGYVGVLIIVVQGNFSSLHIENPGGVILALLSTLVWAYYWIINTGNRDDAVVALCLNFVLAVPLCLLLCMVFSKPWIDSWQGLLAATYVGVFEMGMTFVIWSLALRKTTEVSRVANLIFLAPLFSLLLIHNVLQESVQSSTLIGLLFIISAALIQQTQGQKTA